MPITLTNNLLSVTRRRDQEVYLGDELGSPTDFTLDYTDDEARSQFWLSPGDGDVLLWVKGTALNSGRTSECRSRTCRPCSCRDRSHRKWRRRCSCWEVLRPLGEPRSGYPPGGPRLLAKEECT